MTYGHPALRRVAKPIQKVNAATRALLGELARAMYDAGGVGLAAPQLGIPKRAIVVDVGEGLIELVNPEITRADGVSLAVEACLSVPALVGEVVRAERVTVAGLDPQGRKTWIEGEGLLARALQHEIDHLNGTLFLDRAERLGLPLPKADRDAAEGAAPDAAEAPASGETGTAPPSGVLGDEVAGDAEEPYRPFRTEPWQEPAALELRIVFMGSPAFAVPALKALCAHKYQVVGCVTQPDRPAGRGLEPRPTPVKRIARAFGVPVIEPNSLRSEDALAALRAWAPDVLVVAAYGKLLPPAVLELPRLGAINVHASLLPAHRGAAPIPRALLDGAERTGVTIMRMAEALDAGDILLQRDVRIRASDTAGTLHDKLAHIGALAVMEALAGLAKGTLEPRPQDEAGVTWAPKLTPEDEILDWGQAAATLWRRIRALSPRPGARTTYRGRIVKVLAAWPVADASARELLARRPAGSGPQGGGAGSGPVPRPVPGEVVAVLPEQGLVVATGDGLLLLERVQPAGSRPMAADAFANGYRLAAGGRLGGDAGGGGSPRPDPGG